MQPTTFVTCVVPQLGEVFACVDNVRAKLSNVGHLCRQFHDPTQATKGITEHVLIFRCTQHCKIPLTSLSEPLCGSSGVFCKGLIAHPASAVGMGHGGTWVICTWGVQRMGETNLFR